MSNFCGRIFFAAVLYSAGLSKSVLPQVTELLRRMTGNSQSKLVSRRVRLDLVWD